jgi:hypothetical protein
MIDDAYYMLLHIHYRDENCIKSGFRWFKLQNINQFEGLTVNEKLFNKIKQHQNLLALPNGSEIVETCLIQTGYFENMVFKKDKDYVFPAINAPSPNLL